MYLNEWAEKNRKRIERNEDVKLVKQQNYSLDAVANSTIELAKQQSIANQLQHDANILLKTQCEELSKRNKILEQELKKSEKSQKISLFVNVFSILVALGSFIVSIIALCIKK